MHSGLRCARHGPDLVGSCPRQSCAGSHGVAAPVFVSLRAGGRRGKYETCGCVNAQPCAPVHLRQVCKVLPGEVDIVRAAARLNNNGVLLLLFVQELLY